MKHLAVHVWVPLCVSSVHYERNTWCTHLSTCSCLIKKVLISLFTLGHTEIKRCLVSKIQFFCWHSTTIQVCLSCLYHLHFSAADLLVCLYVHRAIFAYDGLTNMLKLADSGGNAHPEMSPIFSCWKKSSIFVVKLSIRILSPFVPSNVALCLSLLQQRAVWQSWQGSFTSPSLSTDCAKWEVWRQEAHGLLWSAGWVASRFMGTHIPAQIMFTLHIHMTVAVTDTHTLT